jgi:transcriptional regulator with XRE-family HTH domain
MRLGRTIKEIRRRKGMKGCELANKIGISTTSLSLIENDKAFPRKETLDQIAKELDVSVAMMFLQCLTLDDFQDKEEVRCAINKLLTVI